MDAGQHHHLHHHHHHHRHQIQQQQEQILLSNTTSSVNIQGGDTSGGGDRFPQWSIEETRDFVMIRAELDPTFMETKRNKVLWQLIATKMKDKGYHRSAEQCKCKWKNLVTRYKGCETMEPEGLMKQQFPFYNELQTIFAARMQRMLWNEAEGSGAGGGGGSNKKKNAQLSSDDDEEDESDEDGDHKGTTSVKKKRKTSKHTVGSTSINNTTNVGSDVNKNMKEMLEDFMKQQIQMEMQWMKAYEAREEERRIREMEWRQKMEALEKERMMMERRWREREEQTRVREEARAEKRDALINALLNKLRREDNIS